MSKSEKLKLILEKLWIALCLIIIIYTAFRFTVDKKPAGSMAPSDSPTTETTGKEAKAAKMEQLLSSAESDVKAGRWEESLQKYKDLRAQAPGLPAIWYPELNNRIYVTRTEEDVRETEQMLADAAKSPFDEKSIEELFILSKTAPLKGDFEQAVQSLKEIRHLLEDHGMAPEDTPRGNCIIGSVMATEGFFHLFLGDVESAEDLINQGLTLTPENSLAHYFKSLLILEKNMADISPAMEAAKKAVEGFEAYALIMGDEYNILDKTVVKAKMNIHLGDLYRRTGRFDLAEKYINLGVGSLDMNFYSAFSFFQVLLYVSKRDIPEARHHLARWDRAEKIKKPIFYFARAVLDFEENHFKESEDALHNALELADHMGPPQWVSTPGTKKAFKEGVKKLLEKIKDKKEGTRASI